MKLLMTALMFTSFIAQANEPQKVSAKLISVSDKNSDREISIVCNDIIEREYRKKKHACKDFQVILTENNQDKVIYQDGYVIQRSLKMANMDENNKSWARKQVDKGNKKFEKNNEDTAINCGFIPILCFKFAVTVPNGFIGSSPNWLLGLPVRAFEYIFGTTNPDMISKMYNRAVRRLENGENPLQTKKIRTKRFDNLIKLFSNPDTSYTAINVQEKENKPQTELAATMSANNRVNSVDKATAGSEDIVVTTSVTVE